MRHNPIMDYIIVPYAYRPRDRFNVWDSVNERDQYPQGKPWKVEALPPFPSQGARYGSSRRLHSFGNENEQKKGVGDLVSSTCLEMPTLEAYHTKHLPRKKLACEADSPSANSHPPRWHCFLQVQYSLRSSCLLAHKSQYR